MTQKYCDEVANPMEMILFRKMKTERAKRVLNNEIDDEDDITELFQADVKNILLIFISNRFYFILH